VASQTLSEAINRISGLVSAVAKEGIKDHQSFRDWVSDAGSDTTSRALGYRKRNGMENVSEIIGAHFHPQLPLVMLSYTEEASRTLGLWRGAWSPALKICRGIIFDRQANLVALPLPKFFNHDESACGKIPDQTFVATEMYDGQSGMIFHFDGSWRIATRNGFDGAAVKSGRQMLNRMLRGHRWKNLCHDYCLLTEIVHPDTAGYIDYDWRDTMLIGVTDRKLLEDMRFRKVDKIARGLRMPFAHVWPGDNLPELTRLVNRPDVRNREGYVARFAGGKRVKFKFRGYVSAVVERNLAYPGLMSRMMTGSLGELSRELPEEIHDTASAMIEELSYVKKIREEKARLAYLRALPPAGQRDAEYRKRCQDFARWIDAQP